jgi:hypothetical protein
MRYITGTPVQGAIYHQITAQIAAQHSGLGPQNVAQPAYGRMVGKTFQKPLSGSTTRAPIVEMSSYR